MSRAGRVIVVLTLLLVSASCGPKRTAPSDPTLVTGLPDSILIDAASGLEVFTWLVEGGTLANARALIEHEPNPIGLSPTDRTRLHEAGFRIIAVPRDRMSELLTTLPPRAGIDRSFWVQAPEWRSLCAGPAGTQGPVAWVGGRALDLPPGQPRLLCRAWTEPTLTPGGLDASFRIELIAQQTGRSTGRIGDGRDREIRRGRVFEDLSITMHTTADTALILLAEPPTADWALAIERDEVEQQRKLIEAQSPEPEPDQNAEPISDLEPAEQLPQPEQQEPEPADEPQPGTNPEPGRSAHISFGELVLNIHDQPGRRRIVILLPHIGQRPTLLPQRSP